MSKNIKTDKKGNCLLIAFRSVALSRFHKLIMIIIDISYATLCPKKKRDSP